MNGSRIRFSFAAAPPCASSRMERVNAASKSFRAPRRPGLRNSSNDQRSAALFSNGVPVSAIFTGISSARAARAARVSGFLIVCASSRMSAENVASAKSRKSRTRSA